VIDTPDPEDSVSGVGARLPQEHVERFISPLASCFPPGIPREIVAPAAHQIVQAPGYFMHLLELHPCVQGYPDHERAHAASAVRLWQGNSRDSWEGNTLIVDVTN
jgi:hypothetical protein